MGGEMLILGRGQTLAGDAFVGEAGAHGGGCGALIPEGGTQSPERLHGDGGISGERNGGCRGDGGAHGPSPQGCGF